MPKRGERAQKVIGGTSFSSRHPEMQRLDPAVYAIVVEFEPATSAGGSAQQIDAAETSAKLLGRWYATGANRGHRIGHSPGREPEVRAARARPVGSPDGRAGERALEHRGRAFRGLHRSLEHSRDASGA